MGDADDSYDFTNLMPFVNELRKGADLVMGNRFRGGIAPGAMPPLHKYLGNPVLSFIGRLFFRSKIGDFHCGLRGFNRDSVMALNLQATGMEFASEMVVKATLAGQRVTEVPTTLAKDGRSRPPHLRSWRDGWRHLRFLLLFSPRWLFFLPGLALLIAGLVIGAIVIAAPVQHRQRDLRRGHAGRGLGDGRDRLPVRAVLAVHPGVRRLGGLPARGAEGPAGAGEAQPGARADAGRPRSAWRAWPG